MRQNKENVSPMSNEGRNLYVVEHITGALLKLMENVPFCDISISQICNEAGVGRASFYRNFVNKEEVISNHLQKLLDSWAKHYESGEKNNFIEALFEHYWENRNLCLLLYKHDLSYLTLDSIKKACGPKEEQPNIVAYTTAYVSYGLFGWINEWFKRGMQETTSEMANLFEKANTNK